MRKLIHALPILVAILAGSASAATARTAPVRTLHAGHISPSAQLVGLADPTTVAYRPSVRGDASMILRGDDRTVRTVAGPAGCTLSGAGSGLLAGECGDRSDGSIEHLVVTRLDGSVVTRLDARSHDDLANGYTAGSPSQVGAQWIREFNGAKQGGTWWQDINWHTGEVRQSTEDEDRQVDDLDAAGLHAGFCAPLRRVWRGEPDMDANPGYFAAEVEGGWALIEGPVRGQPYRSAFTLHRCGVAHPIALPARFSPMALGDGWVAGLTTIGHGGTRLDVIRLSDRHQFNVRGVGPNPNRVVLTRGRIYATTSAGLSTAVLPQQ